MGDKTAIPYADATWNPMTGCSHASAGCKHCYAERLAGTRLAKMDAYKGLTKNGKWTGEVRLMPERLAQPTRWQRPRVIFGCDMGDLFHESVPFEFISAVHGIAAMATRHKFLFLTKRVDRAARFYDWLTEANPLIRMEMNLVQQGVGIKEYGIWRDWRWPLDNVWLGATVEDQRQANKRIPQLAGITHVVHRWLSLEPLLADVNMGLMGIIPGLPGYVPAYTQIHCVVGGGESGPQAEQCKVEWLRSSRDQCIEAGVPFFAKQLGALYIDEKNAVGGYNAKPPAEYGPLHRRLKNRSGADPSEWPEDLRGYRTAPWMEGPAT